MKYIGQSEKYKYNLLEQGEPRLLDSPQEVRDLYSWVDDLVVVPVDDESEAYILRKVPEEFKSKLSYMAYERGHSAGQSEVTAILKGLVFDLLPAIKAFEQRIRS